ncbi:energy transducer TonB [Dyella soli]|uniref:Protein TonB n=1 Tax=Dyella soli TaxID=522319 RepID=A0A4R0YKJ3_9GAMM|nr:energy transducer TonB [Dyella soli]TCI09049.1 energy transducer TonB [Dyella soli]
MSRRRIQGVARFMLLIVVGLVAIGGVVIFALLKSRAAADDPSPTVIAAAGPVVRAGAGTDELLQHARQAMAEQRLLAPAGNNAFELYLAVLKREPGNRVAQDALREIFPFAAHAAEQTIDQGDAGEAQRQIDLLRRADPQNYTLTLLQTKLQAQRDAAAQQAQPQPQLAQAKKPEQPPPPGAAIRPAVAAAPQVAPSTPAPGTAPAGPPAARPAAVPTAAELALAQLHVESTKVEAAPKSSMRPHAPAVAAVVDANGNAAPVLTRRVDPSYPSDARRSRRQGWVDVTFTVQADGSVSGASVTDADPKYVFDRSALNAVTHWQFTPGMQDGKPVAAQLRQRIEFHL